MGNVVAMVSTTALLFGLLLKIMYVVLKVPNLQFLVVVDDGHLVMLQEK